MATRNATQKKLAGESKREGRALPPKLTAPSLKNLYDRERLYTRLDALWGDHRAIWLSAPGGSGKTSLALGYLASRDLASLWYQIDAGDGDVASFFYYLGKAITHSFPKFRTPMPSLTPEYLGDTTIFARNFFREMYRRIPADLVLVLDNYQEAPEGSALHDVIQLAVLEAPPNITLLVLSRATPPPALISLTLKGLLGRLEWPDLQLTLEETDGMLARRLPEGSVNESAASVLHSVAGGWAAGVVLLAEQTRQFGSARTARIASSGQKVVFDYFASELFARAEPSLQRFLARTALLPQITAATAEILTEATDAEAILDDLARRNFFTVRHPGILGGYFEYHPLFREFLANQASRLFPENELEGMRRKAAHALQTLGETDAAIELFLRADAWNEAAVLAVQQAPAMHAHGRGKVLLGWLTRLPAEARSRIPWVDFWIGICTLPSDPIGAKSSLERAYHGFAAQGDAVGRYSSWCAIVDSIVLGWGNFVPLDPWLDEAEELQKIPPPDENIASRFACAMFIALMYRRPERSLIEPFEAKTWDVVMHGPDLGTRVLVGHNLVLYYAWYTGELSRAKMVVDTLRPLVERAGTNPLNRTGFAATAGAYLWMSGQVEECVREVGRGLATADSSGVHVWDAMLCTQGLFALIPYGRQREITEYLTRVEHLLPQARPMERSLYHYFRAWLDLVRGAAEEASLHLRTAMDMAKAAGALYPYAVYQWGLALVLCHAGRRDQIGFLIDESRRAGESMGSAPLLYEAHLAEAEIHLLDGDEPACVESLRHFLAIGRSYGFRCHTFWRPEIMARLYALALEHGIESEYVTSMVRHYRLAPPEQGAPLAWPWEIKIFALGRMALERDGVSVLDTGGHSTKPIVLLLALATARGMGLSETRLIELLWPESGGSAARQTLRVTLHRLRALVGEEAVVARDGRLMLDRKRCWADFWEFDRLMQQARELGVRVASTDEIIRLSQQLRSLYQGRLFEEESHEFLLLEGERLHDLALQGCVIVAALLQERGIYDELLALLAWGLELEPTAEILYQIKMRSYLNLGQPAAGLAVYDRCRRILATRLGIRPSPQTDTLAEALKAAPIGDGSSACRT